MDAAQFSGGKKGLPKPTPEQESARVLLVDAAPAIAELLRAALRRGGRAVDVVVALSAASGLEQVRHESIDCVIIGDSLPDGDGPSCLASIHEFCTDLPVIVILTEPSPEMMEEARRRGAAECVVRQSDLIERLVAAVLAALAHRESERARKRLLHGVFVGRKDEMNVLRAAIESSLVGRSRLALIEGGAGIGKTTLAKHASSYAESRGMRVLWGHGHEVEGAPPFWPWIPVLRALIADSSDADLRADLPSAAGPIVQIAPELEIRLGQISAPAPMAAPEQARFRLFDAVTTFLRNAARRRPLAIVFDDLQEADRASLLLLDFLARELGNSAPLILATYDPKLPTDHPNLRTIEQLRRGAAILHLNELSSIEVTELIAGISNQKVPARFAQMMFRHTEGNPFFIVQTLGLLLDDKVLFHDGGRWTALCPPEEMLIPSGVHETLHRRLEHVSSECRDTLSVAALIGRHFDLAALAQLTEKSPERLHGLLDEALRARIIVSLHGPVGEYRFYQRLMRGVLYTALASSARADLHQRMGEYLEGRHAAQLDPQLPALTYHFRRSTFSGAAAKTREYALRAAERAAEVFAHEEAAHYSEIALQTFTAANSDESARRYAILLGTSQHWWRAGEGEAARGAAREAAEIARRAGRAMDFASAALAYAGQLPGFGAVVCDNTVVQLLDEALGRLPENEVPLRARLMGRVAEEIIFCDESGRRQRLGHQAVKLARDFGDRAVLASVLKNMHWALWTPEKVQERLALADEVVQLAGQDEAMRFEGHLFRCFALLELADLPAAQEEMAACARLAWTLKQPYYMWLVESARSCIAFTQGRLKDIPGFARAALELGKRAKNPNAELHHDVQLAHLHWLRGDFAALDQLAGQIGAGYPLLMKALLCAQPVICTERDLPEEARAIFDSLAADDFAGVPRDVVWVANLSHLAQVCAVLGEARSAATLYELLLPFEQRLVVLAPVVTYGVASHFLGLLAATMGKRELAQRHYKDALESARRLGMEQWVARTQLAYAQLLAGRGGEGTLVAEMLEQSIRSSEKLGMTVVAKRARALRDNSSRFIADSNSALGRADGTKAGEATCGKLPQHVPEPPTFQLRRDGRYWTLTFSGNTYTLGPHKGFILIACLLRSPGHPFHVIDLCAGLGVDPDSICRPGFSAAIEDGFGMPGDLGPTIDAKGRAKLGQRAAELLAEIDEAEANKDIGMAETKRTERNWIMEVLAEAYGGPKNPAVDRIRQNIQKAIKRARKVAEAIDPAFGRCLRAITTGFVCYYDPDPRQPVRWEF